MLSWRGSVGRLAYFTYALSGSKIYFYYSMGRRLPPTDQWDLVLWAR